MALWGGVISERFERVTTGLAVAETLSPGEFTGGEIYVQKAPSGTTLNIYSLQLGREKFEFKYLPK